MKKRKRKNRKEIARSFQGHYGVMARKESSRMARWWFRRPAYQVNGLSDKARCLIRAQGSQIERSGPDDLQGAD